MNWQVEIARQLDDGIVLKRYLQRDHKSISKVAKAIVKCLKNGNKVLLFGNGGSAADAQHIAAELAGRFYMDRKPLAAIALTTNTSILTAIANDYGYDTVFTRQLQSLVKEGDVAVALSVGGNSPNVVLAIDEAKRARAVTVGITGEGGGKIGKMVDLLIAVPSKDTPRVQEAHITVGHIICYLVEKEIFNRKQDVL